LDHGIWYEVNVTFGEEIATVRRSGKFDNGKGSSKSVMTSSSDWIPIWRVCSDGQTRELGLDDRGWWKRE
jgi:hypothetical protein